MPTAQTNSRRLDEGHLSSVKEATIWYPSEAVDDVDTNLPNPRVHPLTPSATKH